MNTLAVLQSNYIPWRGYFDIINDVDEFIIYDEVQYTKNDWRNRNILYVNGKKQWITLPCGYDLKRTIDEVQFNNTIPWQRQHWELIKNTYAKAPYFKMYKVFFEHVYLENKWEYLSEFNVYLIKHIAKNFLKIDTKITNSRMYKSIGNRQEKLISLLKDANANRYISGSAAKNYIDETDFIQSGIELIWKDYSGYPEYKQLYSPFLHEVSILDVLFNTGENAPYYVWGWRSK